MDPSNFAASFPVDSVSCFGLTLYLQNASWSINSLKVYRKQLINGQISGATANRIPWVRCTLLLLAVIPFTTYIL